MSWSTVAQGGNFAVHRWSLLKIHAHEKWTANVLDFRLLEQPRTLGVSRGSLSSTRTGDSGRQCRTCSLLQGWFDGQRVAPQGKTTDTSHPTVPQGQGH